MACSVPLIEVAGDADHFRGRRPYGKPHAFDLLARHGVRAQRAITLVIGAFAMQVQFEGREQRREAIGIFEFLRFPRIKPDADAIVARRGG